MIWYIIFVLKFVEPEAEMKLYIKYQCVCCGIIICILDPGIEAIGCACELLYIYII